MDISAAIIGSLALGFGLVTLAMRLFNPAKLGKLQPMKERFGETAGNVAHAFFYIALPSVYGVFCLIQSYLGKSFLG
jgi:hypothetical protein